MRTDIYRLLFEQAKQSEAAPENPVAVREPSVKARPAKDSVDDQIDALILRYENASIRAEEEDEEATLSDSLKGMLVLSPYTDELDA